jgi:hypothetical protein
MTRGHRLPVRHRLMLPGGAPDGCVTSAFRWLVRLVAVSAMLLIPWAAYLAHTLPPSVSARHWPLAWTGIDIAMAAGLGRPRGSRSGATGALRSPPCRRPSSHSFSPRADTMRMTSTGRR